ncbi:hypothetical protein ROZALSC1DRAFT_28640 [Rozella allomycis CSF55]|uniref:Uncharacterized protein n=1 Tax=Rozella allomycis (strain CSF55) TaxID=988480 RepID=A0A4P9YK47_ROZAC|nr:hypothetical protein ROZALSC1DRAFT_28640 [Rozella allomycis CSF55]
MARMRMQVEEMREEMRKQREEIGQTLDGLRELVGEGGEGEDLDGLKVQVEELKGMIPQVVEQAKRTSRELVSEMMQEIGSLKLLMSGGREQKSGDVEEYHDVDNEVGNGDVGKIPQWQLDLMNQSLRGEFNEEANSEAVGLDKGSSLNASLIEKDISFNEIGVEKTFNENEGTIYEEINT